MRHIRPVSFGVAEVVEACLDGWGETDPGKLVASLRTSLEVYQDRYQQAGAQRALHQLQDLLDQPEQSAADALRTAYDMRLRDRGPGRQLYNQMRAANWRGLCPSCGISEVAALDHHLPKSRYALFSLTPLNLIPICGNCNPKKGNACSSREDEQFIHPYLERIDQDRWLHCTLTPGPSGPEAGYHVRPPAGWSASLSTRVQRQFDRLGLGERYAAQAVDELATAAQEATMTAADANAVDAASIREHCQDEADRRRRRDPNGWGTALYDALCVSDWQVVDDALQPA